MAFLQVVLADRWCCSAAPGGCGPGSRGPRSTTRQWMALAREICPFSPRISSTSACGASPKTASTLAHRHAQTLAGVRTSAPVLPGNGPCTLGAARRPAVDMVNWIYIWLFWPLLAVALSGCFSAIGPNTRLPQRDLDLRLMDLVIFCLPGRAPTLPGGEPVHRHRRQRSVSYQLLLPHALANLYAAMPSLHAGWVLMGPLPSRACRPPRWRALGSLLPVAMFLS